MVRSHKARTGRAVCEMENGLVNGKNQAEHFPRRQVVTVYVCQAALLVVAVQTGRACRLALASREKQGECEESEAPVHGFAR